MSTINDEIYGKAEVESLFSEFSGIRAQQLGKPFLQHNTNNRGL